MFDLFVVHQSLTAANYVENGIVYVLISDDATGEDVLHELLAVLLRKFGHETNS